MEMKSNLNELIQEVLSALEPDESKWLEWLEESQLQPVSQSACVQAFVQAIHEAKEQKKKVFVFGDYDADGILSTTIMVQNLRRLGLSVGYYIPNRLIEGYGLNCTRVKQAHEKDYEVLITVDNGVKAYEAIELAKNLGMQVLLTDHHRIENETKADVLVHPDLMEPTFFGLCGAGVAYELARALKSADDYDLILAAIASLADVMPVKGQTRAIIQQGLKTLNESKELHVMQLAKTSGRLGQKELSFQVIPKLNAIGRLADQANANQLVEYFLSDDLRKVDALQKQISAINERRKKMSDESVARAVQIANLNEPVLLVYDPSFHEGIIGLAAGNLMNQYNKSTIVLTNGTAGIKGSMRSVPGFDCLEFLREFEDFSALGGHTNAAGFGLPLDCLQDFVSYVRKKASTYTWQKQESSTLEIKPEQISIENVHALESLAPFGPGFECPEFEIKHPPIKTLYDFQNGKHRKYTLENGVQCLRFNQPFEEKCKSVLHVESFVGSMQLSSYQGKNRADFIISKINYKN
jgi:single-stranded-DNA-specific exonuclease